MLLNNTTLITALLNQATWQLSSLSYNLNSEANPLDTLNPLLKMSAIHHHYAPHPWHAGEREMHQLLHLPTRGNPTIHGFPPQYGYRVAESPILAVGALDAQGRPWTTLWGGEPAFARGMGQSVLGVKSLVDLGFDPVVDALFGANKRGEVVAPGVNADESEGEAAPKDERKALMAALSLDPATRDRVKLMGRLLAGAVSPVDPEADKSVGETQLAMLVEESLGNCPKYITIKDIRPAIPQPKLVSESFPLPPSALEVIDQADMIFLSSTDGETMDTNIRGGAPGFVRVASNATPAEGGLVLVYPEYSGNRLYQTLGNFRVRPLVGMVIPNMATGDVLYVTGKATVLVGERAGAVLPRAKLAVRIEVEAVRFVEKGLPFRGEVVERSPYNPPVRALAVEKEKGVVLSGGGAEVGKAVLKGREMLSDTVARFTFKMELAEKGKVKKWRAGQYVTLDFSDELDQGYSHMRDSDPQSLNDDFVRTFTISSIPPTDSSDSEISDGTTFQITARKHGPATGLLWRWNPLELPILGFGGEESFHILSNTASDEHESVFVAAGVGITPFLAQAPELIAAGKRVRTVWSLRMEDLPVALDAFEKIKGLAGITTLFVTGGENKEYVDKATEAGAEVLFGRMGRNDLLAGSDKGKRRFYVCTGTEMLKSVLVWLEGEDTAVESFNY